MTKTLALLAAACAGMATLQPAFAMETGWRTSPLLQGLPRAPLQRGTPWGHHLPGDHSGPIKIKHTCYNIAGRPYETTMNPCPIS